MKKKLSILVNESLDEGLEKLLSTEFDVEVINLKAYQKKGSSYNAVVYGEEESGDINPDYYGENPGKFTEIQGWEKYEDLRSNLPFGRTFLKIGIGNGAQYLNIRNGGSLIQHVEGHKEPHEVTFNNGNRATVESNHHQMMFPYMLDDKSYKILATSTYFKSNTYLNGRNEETTLPKNFLEPEMILFPNSKDLASQSNPVNGSKEYQQFFLREISKLLK